jgi:bifunctional UDP-N-acetylglucosamine pyrophosphorylase/glucosamine-1-phosphate N-acetyltransferase
MTLAVVILAAGQGTRMQSRKQKILHEVGGRPMVLHAFLAAQAVADLPPVLIVGPGEDGVRSLLGDAATYVVQPEPLGPGHATQMAAAVLEGQSGQVLVTYADMPLLRPETMANLAARQRETGAALAMLSGLGPPESTFGRVVRGADGCVVEIVEVAEARRRLDTEALLAIPELNVGVYCFDAAWLWANIFHLPLRQARQGQEYYLTDLVEMAAGQRLPVEALIAEDPDEVLGAGTRAELAAVEKAFRRRTARHWLSNGVTLIDPEATYIDPGVIIGRDTIIWPNTFLQGMTHIGEECVIGPNTILRNVRIGDRCWIEQSVIEKGTVPYDVTIRQNALVDQGYGSPKRGYI